MSNPRVRAVFLFIIVVSFGVLLFGGHMINSKKPPIPQKTVSSTGEVVFTADEIMAGQNHYFSRGGQHIGTIWGHGSYLAPDWSADFLHRMGLFLAARHLGSSLEASRRFTQDDFDALNAPTRARLTALVSQEIKTNRFDAQHHVLTFTPYQTEAFNALAEYYTKLFQDGNEGMGLQPGIVRTEEEGRLFTTFFAWLAWAAGTQRPDAEYTYTTNWPYDPLVGNHPLADVLIWSFVSVILLILGIAVALFAYLRYIGKDEYEATLLVDFPEPNPTSSQKTTLLYFSVAILLFIVQIAMGAITAHYTVEGTHFFGISLAKILPYAAVRTWHLQLGVFFIATCFLAAGLFLGPFVGHEPKRQGLLVVVLFAAIVVVVIAAADRGSNLDI